MRWMKRRSKAEEQAELERQREAEQKIHEALAELDTAVEEHKSSTREAIAVISSRPPPPEHEDDITAEFT